MLGEISFSVYLLHFILINFYIHHRAVFSAWPGGITYCLFCVMVLLLAWIVWAGVERPMRTRILSLWPNRDPQALARQLARAYATPAKSSRWAYISQPGYPSVVVGILILGLLLIPVGMAFYSLDYQAASSTDIAAIVAATPPEIRNARFGDQMELFGATIQQTSSGIELKLACIATANSSHHLALGIHIIDQKGNILAQPDFFENAVHFTRQNRGSIPSRFRPKS